MEAAGDAMSQENTTRPHVIHAHGEGKAINERYRPMRLSEMIGNERTKLALTKWMERGDKRSRALLFSGTSSGGKTTTSRILAMGLNCLRGDTVEPCLECENCKMAMSGSAMHIVEHNMSDLNKVEDMARIVDKMSQSCLTGRNRVFILDEVQRLTTASQNLLLKPLECPPPGVYIILCTTEPEALLNTLRNRCERYSYTLPTQEDVSQILYDVTTQEGIEMTREEKIAFFNHVNGMSYREILFALEQFQSGMGVEGIQKIGKDENETTLYEIASAILYKGDFDKYVEVVASGVNIEYEGLRRMMRSMAGKEIEKAGFRNVDKAATYCQIVDLLDSRPFYDSTPKPTASSVIFQTCTIVKEFLAGK